MQLKPTTDIGTRKRLESARFINDMIEDWRVAREIEMSVHAISATSTNYQDKMHQLVFNLKANPSLKKEGASIVLMDDQKMAKGTIIEDIERETKQKQERFEHILQEKYDKVNRESYRTTLKCGRCGSSDVSWEQKQTRGADEAMTVFCTCGKCNKRWTMR